MAAEQGQGRRATMLSDYTFAVRSGDQFVNVGKAYSGLTDVEVRELTRLLRSIGTDRCWVVLVLVLRWCWRLPSTASRRARAIRAGLHSASREFSVAKDKTPRSADDFDRVRGCTNHLSLPPHRPL